MQAEETELTYKGVLHEVQRTNLSTYYLLPLLGINYDDFGKATFLNSYVSRNGKYLIVKVREPRIILNPKKIIRRENYFVRAWEDSDGAYYLYNFPEQWKHEFFMFTQGSYTQFSDKAKEIICKTCGLDYKVGSNSVTHVILLALEGAEQFKRFWCTELDLNHDDFKELLSKPGMDVYMDIGD